MWCLCLDKMNCWPFLGTKLIDMNQANIFITTKRKCSQEICILVLTTKFTYVLLRSEIWILNKQIVLFLGIIHEVFYSCFIFLFVIGKVTERKEEKEISHSVTWHGKTRHSTVEQSIAIERGTAEQSYTRI